MVGDKYIASRIYRHAVRLLPSGADGFPATAAGAPGGYFCDSLKAKVTDEQVARCIRSQVDRMRTCGVVHHGWRATIGRNFRDLSVSEVADEEIAVAIDCHSQLALQIERVWHDLLTGAVGAACWNFQHLVQIVVCDEEISSSIYGQTLRILKSKAGRRLGAIGPDLDHALVKSVGNEEIARRVQRQSLGLVQRVGASAHGVLRAGAECRLRRLADAVDGRGRQQVAAVVKEIHCAQTQSRRVRSEIDVHIA